MAVTHEIPLWRLIIRSLQPTMSSLAYGFIGALLITAMQLGMLSTNQAFFPGLMDGEWSIWYTNTVARWILTTTNNETLGNMLVIMLWGLIGLLVYSIIAGISSAVRGWNQANNDLQMTGEHTYKRHPELTEVLLRAIWRFALGCLMVSGIFLVQPFVEHAFSINQQVFTQTTAITEALLSMAISVGIWIGILHIYLILLRLYLLRTRIFGEILY